MEINKERYDEVAGQLINRPMIQALLEDEENPVVFMVKMAVVCAEIREALFGKGEEEFDA